MRKKFIAVSLFVGCLVLGFYFFHISDNKSVINTNSKSILEQVEKGEVSSITVFSKDNIILAKTLNEDVKKFTVKNKEEFLSKINNKDIKIYYDDGFNYFLYFLGIVALIISIRFLMVALRKRDNYKSDKKFSDIKGIGEEQKEEIIEYINLIKSDSKIGDIKPRGLLLSGPPGVGKTLIAKAIANEANIPFMSISGSSIGGLIVGKGVRDIKKLFKEAELQAPCIVFIDEFDAIGKKRGGVRRHEDSDTTVNELLVQMDGFDDNSGVYVIAATNYPEELDPAVTRKGRFNRDISIPLPNKGGRKEILNYYLNQYIHNGVNIEEVSNNTYGMSGADIEQLVKEAAIIAVRHKSSHINENHISLAKDRILMGNKITRQLNNSEKKQTAFHEVGHAVIGLTSKYLNIDINKISIEPRGKALGVTMFDEKEDKISENIEQIKEEIQMLLAGRAAEDVFLGKHLVSSGAANDLMRATQKAEKMIQYDGLGGKLSNFFYKKENIKLSEKEKEEIEKFLQDNYKTVKNKLESNKKLVESFVEKLLLKEVLNRQEIKEILNVFR